MNYKKPDDLLDVRSGWCPGCGHGIIFRILAEAVQELGLSEKMILVTDVACGQLGSSIVEYNNIGTAHGRPVVAACGTKRVRPDQVVVANPGDGSAYSIGVESTLHAALRNENILVLVTNNNVFGMTGGQMSPTSLPGQKTSSSPAGRDITKNGNPFDVVKVLGGLDIAYLARGSVDSPAEVTRAKKMIHKALQKQMNKEGFCLVEILSPCPTNWSLTPPDSLKRIREQVKVCYPVGEYVDKGGN